MSASWARVGLLLFAVLLSVVFMYSSVFHFCCSSMLLKHTHFKPSYLATGNYPVSGEDTNVCSTVLGMGNTDAE